MRETSAHWWSDALNDPWRDPTTITILTPPRAVAQPMPEPAPQTTAGRPWLLAVAVGVIAALVAGTLGGALGMRFAGAQAGQARPMFGPAAPAQAPAPDSLAGVAQLLLPSVVTIRIAVDGGTALGSGFIVTPEGHVITNDHVVTGGSGAATVIFDDGSTTQADLVGADPESDVAVLKVAQRPGLIVARMGNSDTVMAGDQVVAIGSPLALSGTVTAGIVSAVDRPIATGTGLGGTRYYAAIQTDAAVNHGNSGGPLVDVAGQVIGINAVIKSMAEDEHSAGNIGLAFAIPINHAQRVAAEIITTGRAKRTVIGAELEEASRDPVGGVRLRGVAAAGPAELAGLRQGDLLLSYNHRPLSEPADLIALVRKTAPGEVVPVTYKRGSTSHNADVTLVADAE